MHVFENLKGDQFVWKMVGKEKAKIILETLWAKQKRSNSKHCYGDYRLRLTIITGICSKLNKFIVEPMEL